MRWFFRLLLAVAVVGGAFLAGSVWRPTVEAANKPRETWDCLGLTTPNTGVSIAELVITATNIGDGDGQATITVLDSEGSAISGFNATLDLEPGEGKSRLFNGSTIYRAVVTTSTTQIIPVAWTDHYDDEVQISAVRHVPCIKRS